MTRDEFRRALSSGHGRAIAFLRHVRPTPYVDVLREEMAFPALRWQSFEDRSWYLLEAARASTVEQEMHKAILALPGGMAPATDNDGAARRSHVVRMVVHLAFRGDARALEIARAWSATAEPGDHEMLAAAYTAEGTPGLLLMARNLGSRLRRGERFHVPSPEELPGADRATQALAALREAAATDADIGAYLSPPPAPEPEPLPSRFQPRPALGSRFEDVEAIIAESAPGALFKPPASIHLGLWAKRASKTDLRRAAQMVKIDDPPHVTQRWLSLFSGKDWPLAPEILEDLALSSDDGVSHAAFNALMKLRRRGLAQVALRAIRNGTWTFAAFQSLAACGTRADVRALREVLNHSGPDRDAEHLWYGMTDVYEKKWPAHDDARAILLWLYEHVRAATPRSGVVSAMITAGSMTPERAEECLLDANDDTREIARKWLAGTPISRPQ